MTFALVERGRDPSWALYSLIGVDKGNREAGRRQRSRNYRFFEAPVRLVFLIDGNLERGSWLDYGMFLENIMISGRARALDTCPQQSIADYPEIVSRHVSVSQGEMILCGMARLRRP